MALSKKWPVTRASYLEWSKQPDFRLGNVSYVQVRPEIWVANMVAQHGIKTGSSGPPIRYDALEKCLNRVREKATSENWSLHMPRIGCGLAGGNWLLVEPILQRTVGGLDVTVYDF